ncbi:uncharacterized protein LOC111128354 isoform X3 [Crassostrea virginica]
MMQKSIGSRFLDVFAYAPGSLRKNVYSLPANVLMICILLCRCVSVGYFVMGLVWKLHTGVIDDSWIRILNRLWIGNLRLGATINGLVLTSVSLFPFYIVSGSFGLMGIFCRKRTFLTLYMVSLLLFLVTDMVFIAFFAVLLDNVKSSSLAEKFQNLYEMEYSSYDVDVKGAHTDWMRMFQTLGCCGVTSINGSPFCSGYERNTCWSKFSDIMTTYCSAYITLAILSFVLQILQLSFCDIIYSQVSGTKLPLAFARSCLSEIQCSWKRSWESTLANIWRLFLCVPAVAFIVLGSILLNDEQMTGQYVHHIYSRLYVLGVNYTDVISWFGRILITLGAVDMTLHVVNMILDAALPESKSRNILFVFLNCVMLLVKIVWTCMCIQLVIKMGDDLRIKMAYLLRQFRSYGGDAWMYLFGELQCCGITSIDDTESFRISPFPVVPFTCCHTLDQTPLYKITRLEDALVNTNCIKTGCLPRMLDIFKFYTTGFFVVMSFSIILGSLVILFAGLQLRSSYLIQKKESTPSEDDTTENNIAKMETSPIKCLMYCKSYPSRLIIMISSISCTICGFTFLTEGIALAFDKVFDHRILKQTLFRSFEFVGLSFNAIRESLNLYLIIYGTVLIIVCGLAFFTLGTKSKCFHVCQTVMIVIVLVLMIIGVGLWGKVKDLMSYQMESRMSEYMLNYGFNEPSFVDSPTAVSGWANLFVQAECCGIKTVDGRDFIPNRQISIYCCKENPLTEPFKTSNPACIGAHYPGLQHNTPCRDAILSRLDRYSNTFFTLSGLTIIFLMAQLSLIIYRLCTKQFTPHKIERHIACEWRILFIWLAMFSSISMVVLGVILKQDSKMTGDIVFNIYQYLYFGGVNYNDIVEAMYLNLIVLGVLSFSCCLLGMSDLFKVLRYRVKLKLYTFILIFLILTKLVCVFLILPIHAEMDTYSNNTNYQFVNIDRQYSNSHSNLYLIRDLNLYYLELDCCGSTGSYGFRDLNINAGYSVILPSYQYPDICCSSYKNVWSRNFDYNFCEKMSCGERFFALANFYDKGLMISMSLTAFFEIICLIFSLYYLHNQQKAEKKTFIQTLKEKISSCSKLQIFGLPIVVLFTAFSTGFLAESAALRYDEIFANKQIYFLFEKLSMAGNSFNTSLLIIRTLLNTSGCLLFLNAVFALLAVNVNSKVIDFMNIVLCCIGICFLLSNLGWWIAFDSEGRMRQPSALSHFLPIILLSYNKHLVLFIYCMVEFERTIVLVTKDYLGLASIRSTETLR